MNISIILLLLVFLMTFDKSYEIKMILMLTEKKLPIQSNNFYRIYDAIKYYKDQHNDFKIPYNYVVPEDNDTIKININNIKLGNIISRMKNRGDYKEYHGILEQKLGFTINSKNNDTNNYDTVINPLIIYHHKFNNLNINTKYVVPNDDETWPMNMRGMHLGSQVDHLRRKKRLLERIDTTGYLMIIFS